MYIVFYVYGPYHQTAFLPWNHVCAKNNVLLININLSFEMLLRLTCIRRPLVNSSLACCAKDLTSNPALLWQFWSDFCRFLLHLAFFSLSLISSSTLDDWHCQPNPVTSSADAWHNLLSASAVSPTNSWLGQPRPPLPALDLADKYPDPNTDLTWRSTSDADLTARSDLRNFTGYGRNIRPLPCVSKGGETGVCMFAWDCMKANGTHLGTCIDRWVSVGEDFDVIG